MASSSAEARLRLHPRAQPGERRHVPEREPRACSVHDADGFVGQLAAREIAMRELSGGADSFVKNSHVVMLFERADDSAQHDHALLFGGLFDFNNLKAPGESGIFLEKFLVFGPSGGSDGAELSASQSGFEQVGGIALSSRAAGSDHGVSFVNEKNDGRGRGFNFFNEALEAIFEFTFDAGAGLQEREIERTDGDILQRRWNVTGSDAQSKTFDNGGFADARFTGEDGIVLTAAREDVNDLANLVIAAEDGVNFASFGVRGQINGELIQILLFTGGGNASGALGQTFEAKWNGLRGFLVFGRASNDIPEILVECFGADLLEFAGDFPHQPRKIA